MERAELTGCVTRILDHSSEVSEALDGIEMLHEQAASLVIEDADEDKGKLFTLLTLLRITMNHVRDQNRFIREEATEIHMDGFKDLSVIQGGK